MRYVDGQDVKIGDMVRLWNDCYGVVVCSMDSNEYTDAYTKETWSYLKVGIMIKTDNAGVFHYIEADEDLLLIKRAE